MLNYTHFTEAEAKKAEGTRAVPPGRVGKRDTNSSVYHSGLSISHTNIGQG